MPIQNPSDIRLNDRKEIEAIIGSPPGWTLRWGITVLLLGLLLLLIFSHFIRYPDVVQARTLLTTENPPIRVTSKADASIRTLMVSNGQHVPKDALLAVLDNPAQLEDVLRLADFIEKMEQNGYSSLGQAVLPEGLRLGSIQASFVRLNQSLRDLKHFLQQDINFQKAANLRAQIAEIQQLSQSLQRQESILQEELNLSRRNMQRDSILFERNSLSRLEYEHSQSAYLQKRREMELLRSGSTQNKLRIQQIKGELLDLEKNQSDDYSSRALLVDAELKRIKGEIELWKETWLIAAPIAGEVVLTKAWSEQQQVRQGEEVLTIVPDTSAGRIVARGLLPFQGAGKVEAGMPAHIRLDGFPYQTYGALTGTVLHIANVPSEMGYEMGISVPENLMTTYGIPIAFRQEMQGTARIVTRDQSLLSRLLDKIISAVKN